MEYNKEVLNEIPEDFISPIIAIRQVCKGSAEAVGKTALKSMEPLTKEEWIKITQWIWDTLFK